MSKVINNFKGVGKHSEEGAKKYINDFIAELKKNAEILNQFVDKDIIVAKAMEQLTAIKDGESKPVSS